MNEKRRWFTNYRMDWIMETLRVFGFINRNHLVRKFELSKAQASADINTFQALHPGAMAYDSSRKCYVAKDEQRRKK